MNCMILFGIIAIDVILIEFTNGCNFMNYLYKVNYLAHAYLSNDNTNLLVGNFIADHVRGNQLHMFSSEIIEGIYLHREIDTFTDSHPCFKSSKRFFYNGFEKHSGILVDMYFDYFLAKNFNSYHKLQLTDFSEKVYGVYQQHYSLLPNGSQRFLGYAIQNNIYSAYGQLEGIEKVLNHLSHRIKHNVALDQSIHLFRKHEHEMQKYFDEFFSEIMTRFGMKR